VPGGTGQGGDRGEGREGREEIAAKCQLHTTV